jgi:hypothetical protein
MVSILEVYWMLAMFMLVNEEEWIFLGYDLTDAAGGDVVTLKSGKGGVSGFG